MRKANDLGGKKVIVIVLENRFDANSAKQVNTGDQIGQRNVIDETIQRLNLLGNRLKMVMKQSR